MDHHAEHLRQSRLTTYITFVLSCLLAGRLLPIETVLQPKRSVLFCQRGRRWQAASSGRAPRERTSFRQLAVVKPTGFSESSVSILHKRQPANKKTGRGKIQCSKSELTTHCKKNLFPKKKCSIKLFHRIKSFHKDKGIRDTCTCINCGHGTNNMNDEETCLDSDNNVPRVPYAKLIRNRQ